MIPKNRNKIFPNYFVIPGIIKTVGIPVIESQLNFVTGKCCDILGMTFEQLTERSRKQGLVFNRQIVVWVCTKATTATLHEIGRHFGIDHSTVLHCRNKVDDWIYLNNDDGREATNLLKKIKV